MNLFLDPPALTLEDVLYLYAILFFSSRTYFPFVICSIVLYIGFSSANMYYSV